MNQKKEKSRKLPWKKKKSKTNDSLASPEEEKPLTVPKEDVKRVPDNHTKPNVVVISEVTQGRINERPVDVGDVVTASGKPLAQTAIPQNNNGHRRPENGEANRSVDIAEPMGSGRVHSFAAKPTQQSTTKPRDERKEQQRTGSTGSPAPKNDSVSFENEKTESSLKKRGSAILRSFRGKSSKKAKKNLSGAFEEEATKPTQGATKESPDDEESSSSEERPDDWDDDPNNPFSSSFEPKKEFNLQTPPVKVQRSPAPPRVLHLEKEGIQESEKTEEFGETETETKKKKRKLKVPSFRKNKKADAPPSPHKSATLPGTLNDQSGPEITRVPDVTFRQTKLPDQQGIPIRSFESPDNFISENQFLSREERNRSKQFSSMRVSNKQPRPVLHFKPEEAKIPEKKEDNGDTFEEDELPPNISKKSRQGANIFSSFRKLKPSKKNGLEKVNEDETENAEATEDHSFSPAHSRPELPGARSSAPPNFAFQSVTQGELVIKQRSQTLPPTRGFNMSTADDESRQGAIAVTVESATLLRKEEIRIIDSGPKQKKTTLGSIKKTLSFKRSSSDKRERNSSLSSHQVEEDTIEEVDEVHPPTPNEEQEETFFNREAQNDAPENEVDLETRKRELENVFKDMESASEEEEKPKPKNHKNIIKALKKKAKKKKSDSESPEAFPLMDLSPTEEIKEHKQKNTAEQIVQVKGQLGELKDIAHDNIRKMEEREENLEELEERADMLSQASTLFHKTAVEVKTEVESSCTCNKKTKTIIIGVVIAVLVLSVIILIAVVSNKSDTTEVRTVHVIHVVNGSAPYYTPSPG